MLGHAILFTVAGAAVIADIVIRLLVAFDGDSRIPRLRIGAAFGPLVRHLGDVFGTTVNLASRRTRLTEPNTIAVSPNTGRSAVRISEFSFSYRGIRAMSEASA